MGQDVWPTNLSTFRGGVNKGRLVGTFRYFCPRSSPESDASTILSFINEYHPLILSTWACVMKRSFNHVRQLFSTSLMFSCGH